MLNQMDRHIAMGRQTTTGLASVDSIIVHGEIDRVVSHILIGVDFSDCGRKALEAGIGLAIDLKADVRLVHAFPRPLKAPVTAGLGYQELFQTFASENETHEAIQLTTQWADKARKHGLDVDVVADARDAADLILEASQADDVSMVVVGTRGKSGIRRFVLGSVAQAVVTKATKPTLVVPC